MAHLIDMSNGRANMAFVGETPWHGLGDSLPAGADMDTWRIRSGLNFHVERSIVQFKPAGKQVFIKGESEVLYRDDTFAQLGIVSDRYQIVQPTEVLEFFRDIVGAGGLQLETAGSLDGGRKVWAMARTGDGFAIKGQDRVDGYLLLSTSFDGSMATRAQFTSVRVVCNNTLQIATADTKGAIKIPHSATFDARGVKIDLGLLGGAFGTFEDQANALANRKLTDKEAMALLASVMIKGEVQDVTEVSTKRFNQIKTVFDLYAHAGKGSNLASSAGTAWGVVNAVTEYVDHMAGNNVNNRFRSGQFGPGATMKNDAMKAALALVA
jgi:phage/plasmid-like protein (TIGR03299 family)